MTQLALVLETNSFDFFQIKGQIQKLSLEKIDFLNRSFSDKTIHNWLSSHRKVEISLLQEINAHFGSLYLEQSSIETLNNAHLDIKFLFHSLGKLNHIPKEVLQNHVDYKKLKSLWSGYDAKLSAVKKERALIQSWRRSQKKDRALVRLDESERKLLEEFSAKGYQHNRHFTDPIYQAFRVESSEIRRAAYSEFHNLRTQIEKALNTRRYKISLQQRKDENGFKIDKLSDFLDSENIQVIEKRMFEEADLNLKAITFDNAADLLGTDFLVNTTRGVGRNKGVTYLKLESHRNAWFVTKGGTVYDTAIIKVANNSKPAALQFHNVSASFKLHEGFNLLTNASKDEKKFIAEVSKEFYDEKGRKLAINSAAGLLKSMRGDPCDTGIFTYNFALARVLEEQYNLKSKDMNALYKNTATAVNSAKE